MDTTIMKTLLTLLIFFALIGNVDARCSVIVLGGTTEAAATCNVSTDELGIRSEDASTIAGTNNNIYCHLHTPECSGKLYTANLRHSSTDAENAKVCVYLDDGDSDTDSGDTLVECSGAIASGSTTGWKNAAMATNPAVSTGSNYWVCLVNEDSTSWDSYYVASGTRKQKTCSGCYASPPENLDGTWSSATSSRDMYVLVSLPIPSLS